ncbi:LpqB family beta-propeller domain-containing protein [Actinoplanes sp. CA-030573]|uniref:LpqB family beta-propeller domain-containing protein n=1 Tax=Actinoplanes sp. CA-030573 TaxID=3239898 RepID=UPI003D8D7193
MRRRIAVLVTLTALLAGGCGIPDETRVTVVGDGPSNGAAVADDSIPALPNSRSSATDPGQLVRYYLEAAAGDTDGALKRVKAFLSSTAQQHFQPGPDVRVIRLKGSPLVNQDDPNVTFNAQTIGTLNDKGSLEPSSDLSTTEYTVRVGTVSGQSGLFITKAPPVLLLTDTALDDFYQRRTIYFWNNENTSLIPDLRYMPRIVPQVQQPTTILNWLVNGPSSWLADAAHGLPTGTQAPDNVPAATDDTLEVTLSGQAVPSGDPQALDRLRRQIQWSFRQLGPHTIALKIGHADPIRYSSTDYYGSNPAYRLADQPERFVIYNNTVRRMARSTHATDRIPVLKDADNKGIASAAMSSSDTHTYLAAVTSGKAPKLRVAAARTGEQADLRDVPGIAGTLGRPVWATTAGGDPSNAIGLIIAGGRLYSFTADGARAKPIDWQGSPGAVTAVSVAPDGYRVAIVSGGRLYRAVLDPGGDTLSMSGPQQLVPPTFSSVTAVAWSSETFLAVAGVREDSPRYAVIDVTADGALPYTRLADIGNRAVTYLTAYPSNPVTRGENSDLESYEAAGSAWDIIGEPSKIETVDLAGAPASPAPGVSPIAPFFLT